MRPNFTSVPGLVPENLYIPRIGKIRLGIKKLTSQGVEYPSETDYFVCDNNFDFKRVYGSNPKKILVFFPVEDVSKFLPFKYELYGSNGRVKCTGNGENGFRARRKEVFIRGHKDTRMEFIPVENFNYLDEVPKLKEGRKMDMYSEIRNIKKDDNEPIVCCTHCPQFDSGECTLKARLMVFVPEVTVSGIFEICFSSKRKLIDLMTAIEFFRDKDHFGRITRIPFYLKLIPYDDTSSGAKRTHYTFQLILGAQNVQQINQLYSNEHLLLTFEEDDRTILLPPSSVKVDDTPIRESVTEQANNKPETVKTEPKGESITQPVKPATKPVTPSPTQPKQKTLKENWDTVKQMTGLSEDEMLKNFCKYIGQRSQKEIVATTFDFVQKNLANLVNAKLEKYISDNTPPEQEEMPL